MSPSQLFEPTYIAIKQRLMQGIWLPGMRLEAARLASDLDVSISPVRDSLNRLAGERMIEATSGAGFRVVEIDDQGLLDMLDLNLLLLRFAMHAAPRPGALFHDVATDPATRVGQIFAFIARQSGNIDLMMVVANLNDRLHVFRRLDGEVLDNVNDQMLLIIALINTPAPSTNLEDLVVGYHDEAKRQAARYIHALGLAR